MFEYWQNVSHVVMTWVSGYSRVPTLGTLDSTRVCACKRLDSSLWMVNVNKLTQLNKLLWFDWSFLLLFYLFSHRPTCNPLHTLSIPLYMTPDNNVAANLFIVHGIYSNIHTTYPMQIFGQVNSTKDISSFQIALLSTTTKSIAFLCETKLMQFTEFNILKLFCLVLLQVMQQTYIYIRHIALKSLYST